MSMSADLRKGQSAEMNVTPLIDVLLVLIIIFMVVMPHHSLGEQADIPQTATKHSRVLEPELTIVVQLHDEGEGTRPALKINQEQTSWEQLVPRMKEIMSPRVERVAFMQADGNVEFAYVAEAVAMTRAAGAGRIGLLSDRGR
jgi:biopolymer transport protein TolR